jgi:serine/threonine-protein kinase HipA
MLNLPSTYKYERNFGSSRDVKEIRSGISFSKLFEVTALCEVPAKAKLAMLQWSLFNLIIGNSDAHGKNFSFFVDRQGIRPTPYYDLVCILIYEEIEHDLAMSFADEFNPEKIFAYQLREFAENIDIHYKLVSQTLKKLCDGILSTLNKEFIDVTTLSQNEIEFIEKLKALIIQRAIKLKESALEMPHISW